MVPLSPKQPPWGASAIKVQKNRNCMPLMGLFIVSFFYFLFQTWEIRSICCWSLSLASTTLSCSSTESAARLTTSTIALRFRPSCFLGSFTHSMPSPWQHPSSWQLPLQLKGKNSYYILSCVAVSRLRLSIFYYVVLAKSCQVQVYIAKAIKTLHME